ncbi:MAG: hypothetical protein J7K75_01150 [Desulfuromonas sp.]|nr:hypothetical protein [Desulfuromonas sp.]
MDINISNNATPGMSVLNRANEQQKQAPELLEKAIEGTTQPKVDETQQAELAAFTGKGQLINTTA